VIGNGGKVVINASEFVEVSGIGFGAVPSSISSSAVLPDEAIRQALGLPPVLSGIPGSIEINTPQLVVARGGDINVRNNGTGPAGSLRIHAETISLDDGGSMTAATQSGEGGNVVLRIDDSLQLRRASQITVEAGGQGNGGNLTIVADTISLLEGSTIDVNAFEGRGGNIGITTRGLFVAPDSRITASSQLGVDGVVSISQLEVDTDSTWVSLTQDPIDPTTQIVSVCGIARENSFIVTGNGGIPPDPTDVLRGQNIWVDMRLSEIRELSPPIDSRSSEEEDTSFAEAVRRTIEPTLVEATGWHLKEDGTVELVATRSSMGRSRFMPSNFLPSNCPPGLTQLHHRCIVEQGIER